MSNIKSSIPRSVLWILYYDLIYSHILYSMSAWALSKASNLTKIGTLMVKAWCLFADYNDQHFLKRYKFLNVATMYNLFSAKMLNSCVNIKVQICVQKPTHNHPTRFHTNGNFHLHLVVPFNFNFHTYTGRLIFTLA